MEPSAQTARRADSFSQDARSCLGGEVFPLARRMEWHGGSFTGKVNLVAYANLLYHLAIETRCAEQKWSRVVSKTRSEYLALVVRSGTMLDFAKWHAEK